MLCFWGILEISRNDLATKTVTWLPVIDIFVPDQKEHVRCHLKMALVDVKSGAWSILRTEPVETEALTTGWSREHIDAPEIRALKARSHEAAVQSRLRGN